MQLQLAPCAPPGVNAPPDRVNPVGSKSATVIVPELPTLPLLVTVSVYVVVPPAATVALPLVLLNPRLTVSSVSVSIAQPRVGWSVAEQSPAVPDVGVEVCGSLPPPTCALLITVLPPTRLAPTLATKLNVLEAPSMITTAGLVVQVIA